MQLSKLERTRQMIGFAWPIIRKSNNICQRDFTCIEKQQYVVIGDAYEEYLLDEVSLQNPKAYLVRIMVHIKEPSDSGTGAKKAPPDRIEWRKGGA
ncbi:hypothetical protein [Cohnella rhizosphaerae]|uniref:Uncharacterized protein n=1 Tax=Cohnella rhizosphaerae TaxID=1457232 RepID=A0A9X4KYB0_9BACL|nr:hypothetical protein [Cohnella rhizosphaerae]MDG0813589.1 hypothetical protein [Cohnella rhizosphaerae]